MPLAPTIPGGADRAVNFNDAGGFGGASNVAIDTAGNLNVSGPISYGGAVLIRRLNNNFTVGTNSIPAAATGQYNLAIGDNALLSLTTGQGNLAFGGNAGLFLTSGQQNLMIGAGAGQNLTGGSYNTLFGSGAGATATTEQQLTLLGSGADSAPGVIQSFAIGQGAYVGESRTGVLGPANATGFPCNLVSGGTTARGKLDLIGFVSYMPVLVCQAASEQTGPLAQFFDPGGKNTLFAVNRDGSLALPTLADSAAGSNSLFFSSTQSKLAFKDASGNLHTLGN